MEKITEEDVSVLMECFRNLDVDDSGTLTEADIIQQGKAMEHCSQAQITAFSLEGFYLTENN